jgi:uncharacterized protein (TIRG00374 family)
MKKRNQGLIMAAAVTAVLLYLTLSHVKPADIVYTLKSTDPLYLVISFFIYVCCNIFRAMRFYVLLDKRIKIHSLFNIVCVYNMVNNMAPMRAGEISYVYMLKRLHNKNAAIGVSTLIVARILDFIAICSLFTASSWIAAERIEGLRSAAIMVSLLIIACFLLLIMLLRCRECLLYPLDCYLDKNGLDKDPRIEYIILKLREMIRAMESMRDTKMTVLALIISFFIWIANFSVVFLVVKGMNFDIPLHIVIMGSTSTVLSTLLPVYGIAGLGTSQGLWTLVFVPLGISLNDAIISAFGYYIIQMIFYLTLGVYGLISLKIVKSVQQNSFAFRRCQ